MIPFSSHMDLTKNDREIEGGYYGDYQVSLEARLLSDEPENKVKVGVSLWSHDVKSFEYDDSKDELLIEFDPQYITNSVFLMKNSNNECIIL